MAAAKSVGYAEAALYLCTLVLLPGEWLRPGLPQPSRGLGSARGVLGPRAPGRWKGGVRSDCKVP